jgi:hypothetical protein
MCQQPLNVNLPLLVCTHFNAQQQAGVVSGRSAFIAFTSSAMN